jgi:hypothetical protein
MDAAVTDAHRRHRHPKVTRFAALMPSHVQTACPERAPLLTEQQLAGGQAPDRGATPGRRGPEFPRGFEVEGKIKGRGTSVRENPVCTWGWRYTRLGPASCREHIQTPILVRKFVCFVRWCATGLESITS